MQLNEYQNAAAKTALYPGQGTIAGLVYTTLGLGESGEVQGKVKKLLRDAAFTFDASNFTIPPSVTEAIVAELGDTLWYVSNTAKELGLTLEDVAVENIKKLSGRAERGTITGSGDKR